MSKINVTSIDSRQRDLALNGYEQSQGFWVDSTGNELTYLPWCKNEPNQPMKARFLGLWEAGCESDLDDEFGVRDRQETFVSKQLVQVSLFLFRNEKQETPLFIGCFRNKETGNKIFVMCFGNKETRNTLFGFLFRKQRNKKHFFQSVFPKQGNKKQ